jgi:hypothetical protein
MHKKTFERLQAEVAAAEAIVDDYDAIMVEAINERNPKSKRRRFSDQPDFHDDLDDLFTKDFTKDFDRFAELFADSDMPDLFSAASRKFGSR